MSSFAQCKAVLLNSGEKGGDVSSLVLCQLERRKPQLRKHLHKIQL